MARNASVSTSVCAAVGGFSSLSAFGDIGLVGACLNAAFVEGCLR